MTEDEERKRGSYNLTLLEEVIASASWNKELAEKYPDLPFAIHGHLIGMAALLDDVAVKLAGLRAGKSYDEA